MSYTITAHAEEHPTKLRRVCDPKVYKIGCDVDVLVAFDKGDHEAALAALERCVEDVKSQIAESHAPTWGGPRSEGIEE